MRHLTFLKYRRLEPSEDGANCTETCRGNNTVTIHVKLTYNFWKIQIYYSEIHGMNILNGTRDLLFFWDVTQRKLILSYRRFGTPYRSNLQKRKSS